MYRNTRRHVPEGHNPQLCVESVIWQQKTPSSYQPSLTSFTSSYKWTSILCCQTTITLFLHKLASYKSQQRHCQVCFASEKNSGFIPSCSGLTQMFTAAKRLRDRTIRRPAGRPHLPPNLTWRSKSAVSIRVNFKNQKFMLKYQKDFFHLSDSFRNQIKG